MKAFDYPPFTGFEPCATTDPELFFTDPMRETRPIRETIRFICSTCSLLAECREWGVRHEEYGWWGGLSGEERRVVRRQRGLVLLRPELAGSMREAS